MSNTQKFRNTLRKARVGNRSAVIVATTLGFAVGAAGFAAAKGGPAQDDSVSRALIEVTETSVDSTSSSTAPSSSTPTSVTITTVDVPVVTIDDSTSSSVPSNSTVTTIDDSTSSSIPNNSVPTSLPGPFTKTYSSTGGSITVSWSGTSFSLVSISPAGGYDADIKDNSSDRIRVEFENDDNDYRIEVRLNDGSIRVRID